MWSRTMVGEDGTSDGDKTLDVGMEPQMWGQNPGLHVQGSGSGMCPMMMDGNTSGVGELYVGQGTPVPLSPP